jgi:hypothetical protein
MKMKIKIRRNEISETYMNEIVLKKELWRKDLKLTLVYKYKLVKRQKLKWMNEFHPSKPAYSNKMLETT